MIDSLKNTVTFSGADITVIAYKSGKLMQSPASRFKIDGLEKKLKSQFSEIAIKKKELKKRQNELLTADEGLSTAINRKKRAIIEDTEFYRSTELDAEEGRMQNGLTEAISAGVKAQFELEKAETLAMETEKDIATLSDSEPFFILGSLHTISYSSFREKFAVRGIGRVQPKGYTRGSRTVAGTMVFTMFQEHELLKLGKELSKDHDHPEAAMLDQIDPFNIMLLFANEYGAYSALHLFDVELQAEGQEMSIDQVHTHNTLNFYAKEMLPMKDLGNLFGSYNQMITNVLQTVGKNGVLSEGRPGHREKIDNKIGIKDEELTKMLGQSRGLF